MSHRATACPTVTCDAGYQAEPVDLAGVAAVSTPRATRLFSFLFRSPVSASLQGRVFMAV
jgi:hypothetical protein